MSSNGSVNIIRRIEVVEAAGHHGGAWKVAFADFMTAMMAFFLLMWILSSSDEQKLKGIAEYFTNATLPGGSGILDGATLGPPGTLSASNGATIARGSDLGEVDDETPALWEVKDTTPTSDPAETVTGSNEGRFENPAGGGAETEPQEIAEFKDGATMQFSGDGGEPVDLARAQDDKRFEKLETEIMQAMQQSQDLRPLMKNIIFERTPDGLRIQIIDQDGQPMFPNGSTHLSDAASLLMKHLGQSLATLPNEMVISGHTDSVPFSDGAQYDNWDLSSDRANSMRRILTASGVAMARITRVSGMADTDPLYPEKTEDPANRRISVLLAYEAPSTARDISSEQELRSNPKAAVPQGLQAEEPKKAAAVAPLESVVEISAMTNLDDKVFENLRSALR